MEAIHTVLTWLLSHGPVATWLSFLLAFVAFLKTNFFKKQSGPNVGSVTPVSPALALKKA
jgi:hypothetical protein